MDCKGRIQRWWEEGGWIEFEIPPSANQNTPTQVTKISIDFSFRHRSDLASHQFFCPATIIGLEGKRSWKIRTAILKQEVERERGHTVVSGWDWEALWIERLSPQWKNKKKKKKKKTDCRTALQPTERQQNQPIQLHTHRVCSCTGGRRREIGRETSKNLRCTGCFTSSPSPLPFLHDIMGPVVTLAVSVSINQPSRIV